MRAARQAGTVQGQSTGREFGITPVRGVRAFGVDDEGRLVGTTGYVYEPGENAARCDRRYALGSASHAGWGGVASHLASRVRDVVGVPHEMARCSCGFYAFHDGVSDFDLDPVVSRDGSRVVHGVIEGYGRTTIGARGFRAERARVLAVAVPPVPTRPVEPTEPDLDAVGRARLTSDDWVAVSVDAVYATLLYSVVAVLGYVALGFVLFGLGLTDGPYLDASPFPVLVTSCVVLLGVLLVGYWSLRSRERARREATKRYGRELAAYRETLRRYEAERARTIAPELVDLLRDRYPGVAVLPSLPALLAEFPPDPALDSSGAPTEGTTP